MTEPANPDEPGDPADPDAPIPPPPQPPVPYRRLWRSRSDRKLGGVAGGLSNHLGVDPTLIRIVFVVLAFTGVTILFYIVAWILVPNHPEDQPERTWHTPGISQRHMTIAIAVGAIGLGVAMVSGSWTLVAVGLIAAGFWLLNQQTNTDSLQDPVPQPSYSAASYSAASHQPGWADAAHAPETKAKPREPQRITRAVLSLLLVLIGVGIAAARADWSFGGAQFLGIAVLIIGVGVVVATMTELGGRWLIPLGLFGVLLLIPVTTIDDIAEDGFGSTHYRPLTLVELDTSYRHGIGELTLDLRNLDFDGERRQIDLDLGVGEVVVYVPADVGGFAQLEAGAGELKVNLLGLGGDVSVDGLDSSTGKVLLEGDRGRLEIDIEVGVGLARVEVGS